MVQSSAPYHLFPRCSNLCLLEDVRQIKSRSVKVAKVEVMFSRAEPGHGAVGRLAQVELVRSVPSRKHGT